MFRVVAEYTVVNSNDNAIAAVEDAIQQHFNECPALSLAGFPLVKIHWGEKNFAIVDRVGETIFWNVKLLEQVGDADCVGAE